MKRLKNYIAIILMSMSLFAQQQPCPISTLPGMAGGVFNTAEELNCMATRAHYQCEQLEKELQSSEVSKVIQCNKKSLAANTASNMNLPECVWNGIKMSGESLSDLSKIPGKLAESIAKGFKDTQACNQSVDKKREILNALTNLFQMIVTK